MPLHSATAHYELRPCCKGGRRHTLTAVRQSEAADGEVVDGQEIVASDEIDRIVADQRYPEVAVGISKRTSGKVVVGDCPCAGSWSLRNLRLEHDLCGGNGCRRLAPRSGIRLCTRCADPSWVKVQYPAPVPGGELVGNRAGQVVGSSGGYSTAGSFNREASWSARAQAPGDAARTIEVRIIADLKLRNAAFVLWYQCRIPLRA